ncbi:MAG: hypothetical protein K9G33_08430 [Sneathiella sp.]|nr:hypothetical protein [Sneathiella sp.]
MKSVVQRAVLGAALFTSAPALADPFCLPRSELAVYLAEHFGESLIAQGLDNRGLLTEVFASRSFQSWTLTETDVTGRACLKAAGEYWNALNAIRKQSRQQPAGYRRNREISGE